MAKDFYSPREIVFTRVQALWLIHNLGSLRAGYYPPEATSYIDIPIRKKTASRQAPFITPIEYAAEITSRLEKCTDGHIPDGLILLAIECWGESEESMANYFRIPVWSVRKRYKRALAYVASGPDRRWHDTKKRKGESYQEFKKWKKK